MTNHRHVVTCRDTQAYRVLKPISGKDCAHVEIVSHDETIETEFAAQQIGYDPTQQRSRRLFRLKAGIPDVTDHHAVYIADDLPKYSQYVLIQLFAGTINSWHFIVS